MGVQVPGIDGTFVIHKFRQLGGLTSRSGAHVQHPFPGLRGQHIRRNHGGQGLGIAIALVQEFPDVVGALCNMEGLFFPGHRFRFYPLFLQKAQEGFPVRLEGIHAYREGGNPVHGFHHLPRFLFPPLFLPPGDEPFRLIPGEGIVEDPVFFPGEELDFFFPSDIVPEDGVHESRISGMGHLFGNLHGFIDRCGFGNPGEVQELVEPQAEKNPHGRMEFLHRPAAQLGNHPEQAVVPPENSIDQFCE